MEHYTALLEMETAIWCLLTLGGCEALAQPPGRPGRAGVRCLDGHVKLVRPVVHLARGQLVSATLFVERIFLAKLKLLRSVFTVHLQVEALVEEVEHGAPGVVAGQVQGRHQGVQLPRAGELVQTWANHSSVL